MPDKLEEVYVKGKRESENSSKFNLDEVLAEEEKDMARKAKQLRVKEFILERERKVKELEKKLFEKENKGERENRSVNIASNITVDEAKEITKLPEEERAKVIAVLQAIRSTPPQKGVDPMLYLLMGFMRTNPQAQTPDIVQYATATSNLIKTGAELAKTSHPEPPRQSGTEQAVQFLNTVKDMIVSGIRDPIITAIKENRPSPSVFEAILLDDKLYERAKDLGIFSKPQPAPAGLTPEVQTALKKIDLEIEQEKTRREQLLRKEEREWDLEKAKLHEERRRTELLAGTVDRIVSGVIKEFTVEEGEGEAVEPASEPRGEFEVKNCPKCNAEIPINLAEKPERVRCEACGSTMRVKY